MLSNYKEHPTKTNYLVFSYTKRYSNDYFRLLLENSLIPYEYHEDGWSEDEYEWFEDYKWYEEDFDIPNLRYMIAVKTTYRKQAVKNNFLAYGKFRKRTISHKGLKYFLLLFFFGLITLAFLGYINSNK